MFKSDLNTFQKTDSAQNGGQKMWQRVATNSNSVVVARKSFRQSNQKRANFVDSKNFFGVFLNRRKYNLCEGQNAAEEDFPFFVFLEKRKVDFIWQRGVLVVLEEKNKDEYVWQHGTVGA